MPVTEPNGTMPKKLARALLLFVLYGVTAFLILHIFMLYSGWFRELTDIGFSFDRMLSFTADRPFAYRVLMPILINTGALLFPPDFIHEHSTWLLKSSPLVAYAHTSLFLYETIALKVHLAYMYLFLSLFVLQYAIRAITRHIYSLPALFSAVAPAAAVLLLPFTFRWGSHLYDFPELLLIALSLLCILKRKWLCYYPLYILAILNKEVNVLLFVLFIAICRDTMPKKVLLRHTALQVILGAALVMTVRFLFADHPLFLNSSNFLKQNIAFWFNPATYFLFWDPYLIGLPIFPRASNILLIYTAIFFVFYKWQEKPVQLKRLFLYTFMVNIPLFIYGGWFDEIRTLALLFPALYLLGVYSLYCLIYPSHSGRDVIRQPRKAA